MKLSKITCEEFAAKLASKEPVPGGGGVAALVGALGAALGSMVGNYSIGKKKFLGMEAKHQEIIDKSCDLMTKLLALIDEDAENFEPLSKAYGMPVGIYIYKIVPGGAAASSDLKEKDIITKFDGQSVTTMEELKNMLTYYEGGSTVTMTVQSLVNGAYVEHDVTVTLGTKPASNS